MYDGLWLERAEGAHPLGIAELDLGLDTVRTSGRAGKSILAEVVRELTPADLALLETERGVKAPSVKRIRDSHHAVARCVAEGKTGLEIQLITGYSASRISILKGDPAFQELVSFYAERVSEIRDQAFVDTQAKLAAIGSDALDEIADRLNDKPESFDNEELESLAKLALDRTGHGPQSKSTNLNVNVDYAARVSAGRQRAARFEALSLPASAVGVLSAPVEGEVVDSTPPSPPPAREGGE